MAGHIFLSAGEPSGDLHASNLVLALRRLEPQLRCSGLGGRRLQQAGCQLLFPLAEHAVMGLWPALRSLPLFYQVLQQVEDWLRHQRPDLVVLVDNPGFNWHVARRAKKFGIPVWYFVPPQLWAWAGWRVRKMRQLVEHVLSGLPFETTWFRRHGVATDYVGHPYCDALAGQPRDEAFIQAQHQSGATIVGLLPGSRTHEVRHNFPTLLRTACIVAQHFPGLRFLVACYQQAHADWIADYLRDSHAPQPTKFRGVLHTPVATPLSPDQIEVHVGKTAAIIEAAQMCVAVSGSVTLELLYHARPSCVVYRISPLARCLKPLLLTCRYITLVNLLAERMVFPEFVSVRCPARQIAAALLFWLDNPAAWQRCRDELNQLRQRFFQPGACQRAAQLILRRLQTAGRRAA
ncbi:Lipid-A-disaccharide synthase [bacterium HR36]|nr:Lipid-A-disaccharide synthase [bacterium HR36]